MVFTNNPGNILWFAHQAHDLCGSVTAVGPTIAALFFHLIIFFFPFFNCSQMFLSMCPIFSSGTLSSSAIDLVAMSQQLK